MSFLDIPEGTDVIEVRKQNRKGQAPEIFHKENLKVL